MSPILALLTLFAFQLDRTLQQAATPIVMWHGMGDSCCNPLSLGRLKTLIESNTPNGTYVKSLQIGDDMGQDIENSFRMNVNLQVENACRQISQDKNLANGYNAIGFSQGGQFLRAVAQRCPNPPIFNLISVGGQHQGVYGFPHCFYPKHKWCDYLRELLNHGAYWGWVQNNFVQAEYWHDPIKESEYIKYSVFLADINNEKQMNYDYRRNLMRLKNFVMIMFENDSMMIPKESAWFGFYSPGQAVNITKLQDSVLYQVDRIGLKRLNEEGKLHFISLPGDHLRFTKEWFVDEIIRKYFLQGSN